LRGKNSGDRLSSEARGQVPREQRIGLRSRDGFVQVVAMIAILRMH
jgi:hypothetical protein